MAAIDTSKLAITLRPLDALRPDPGNARTHSKAQVAQIAASLRAFGFVNPILLDEAGLIIAGHGRLRAAREIGLAEVPTITLEGLTPAQARALRLADNKIALNAGWDGDLLKVELEALSALDIDLSLTGFSIGEIDVVLGDADDPDDDAPPAAPAEPRARPGDIWTLGPHRIGCGDVRDTAFLRELTQGAPVDAAFLDPPYNVRIEGHANLKRRHREFAMASGEMSPPEFTAFLTEALGACASVSRPGAVHFVCMDWRHLRELQAAGDQVYGELLNLCVWNKSNAGMGSLYRSRHELVLVYRVGDAPHLNAVELGRHGRHRTNVWDYASVNSFGARSQDLELHPTVKPTALVADALKDVTRQGDSVLDAFLGSGTTLIAAERTRRRCLGLEIDPLYVDIALERWSALTGLAPTLAHRTAQEDAA